MKPTEWQELQRLLKVADQQGFVQEALVETGLAVWKTYDLLICGSGRTGVRSWCSASRQKLLHE